MALLVIMFMVLRFACLRAELRERDVHHGSHVCPSGERSQSAVIEPPPAASVSVDRTPAVSPSAGWAAGATSGPPTKRNMPSSSTVTRMTSQLPVLSNDLARNPSPEGSGSPIISIARTGWSPPARRHGEPESIHRRGPHTYRTQSPAPEGQRSRGRRLPTDGQCSKAACDGDRRPLAESWPSLLTFLGLTVCRRGLLKRGMTGLQAAWIGPSIRSRHVPVHASAVPAALDKWSSNELTSAM
jgi:hypothetical protein